jgi:hemolysin III
VSAVETVDEAVSQIKAVLERPKLRGRLHLLAALVSVGGLVWLVRAAESTEATVAAWVYGISALLLYATSGTYHCFARTQRARRIMQRADHSMIYLLIAGTYTPVCLAALPRTVGLPLLAFIWLLALVGVTCKLLAGPRLMRASSGLYVAMGWVAMVALPSLLDHLRPAELVLLGVGGLLYTIGAVVLYLRRPDPRPAVFGYHEVWHAFTVAAAACHFGAVALLLR